MPPTYATTSNQVAALKELYDNPSNYMKNLVYKKNPFLALVSKDESPGGFAGKYIPVPIVTGTPQGRSATFAQAQANQTAPVMSSFFVYRVKNYQLATIENEIIEATKDNAGAFIDEAKLVNDTAIRNLSNDLAFDLFSSGQGNRGAISSITTGVITLVDPNSVVNFEVGMALISFDSTYANQSTSVALGYVIGVNRTAGTVTVSATAGGAAGTPTNWSTSFPNLVVSGDAVAAQTSMLKVSGLGAWLPFTTPAANDSFWGVNRSSDPTRLAGIRFDGSAETIEEALIDTCMLAAREGAQPDMCFTNFASYGALEKSLGTKVQYVSVNHDEAEIAFAGIRVNAPYGPITIMPDRSCPATLAYILDMDSWKFRSLGKAPHILTYGSEGLDGLRVGTADALEIRWAYYGNLICNGPGFNAVCKLSQ